MWVSFLFVLFGVILISYVVFESIDKEVIFKFNFNEFIYVKIFDSVVFRIYSG